jgi:hypothetical protein
MPVEPPNNTVIMPTSFSFRRVRSSATTFAAVGLAFSLAACEAETLMPQLDEPRTSEAVAGSVAAVGTYPVPSSIDATGSKDVSKEFQAFLATVPNGSTIVFPAGAKYRMEETLTLTDRNGLTFEGNGASIVSDVAAPFGYVQKSLVFMQDTIYYNDYATKNRTRQHIRLVGGSNYVFRNLTVRGPHAGGGIGEGAYVAALEAQHGFDIRGVRGVELDRVTVTNVYGDFLYMTHRGMVRGVTGPWSSDIRVHDSRFERNGRQGVAFNGVRGVLFERNYMGEVRRAHFDLEPNSLQDGTSDVMIRDNTFGPGRLNFMSSQGAAAPIENITVQGNRLIGKSMTVNVKPRRDGVRRNFRFINNISDATFGSTQPLLSFYRISGLEVRGNRHTLKAGRQMTAVYAEASCQLDVQQNEFLNAALETRVVGTCP